MAGAGSEFSLQAALRSGQLKPELRTGRAQRMTDHSHTQAQISNRLLRWDVRDRLLSFLNRHTADELSNQVWWLPLSRKDKDPFMREFSRWLDGSHSRLFQKNWILKQINQIRTPAVHGGSARLRRP